MDLYDDLDTKQRAGQIDGWSSGIKMLQTQLAIKKATLPPPRREPVKKPPLLAPICSLKQKVKIIDEDLENEPVRPKKENNPIKTQIIAQPLPVSTDIPDYDWEVIDEYNPLWPNEYEKIVKDKRDKDKERRDEHHHHRDRERKRKGSSASGNGGSSGGGSTMNNARFDDEDASPSKFSGFGGRLNEEDNYSKTSPPSNSSRVGGAAIAPPPSLQDSPNGNSNNQTENSSTATIPYGATSVAAKIMARYGFKDGQGLGKQEQGMSMALQVEKTSKRGGRIIHEKELLMPPPPPAASSPPSPVPVVITPDPPLPIPQIEIVPTPVPVPVAPPTTEPTITEIMKSPSKVVLLRNMVGPGDVDSELEPEVKDECNTKYGDVISVVIKEVAGVVPEESVRIFVEFKRIESAIKAVVDLSGRFFGGRQVRAGFYDYDKFKFAKIY